MRLDVVSDMRGIANEGTPLKICDLLRKAIFNDKPNVTARHCSALVLIGKASDVDGGRGVHVFGVYQ